MDAKILLIEDSPGQGTQIRSVLEHFGFEVSWVQDGLAGFKSALRDPPDLILLDLVMEDVDGTSVCRWLKLREQTRSIPVIMLTVRGDVQSRVEGLHIGADDYIAKPVDNDELEARIYAALRSKAARDELRERNRELEQMLQNVEQMAITDALTGLHNRRRFNDALRREWAVGRRYGIPLSCLMLDLDHFKSVNDRFGHGVGDTVLKATAGMLSSGLREVDVVARYGGEEFALLLPHTLKEHATQVAERVLAKLRAHPFEVGGEHLTVTASIGVSATSDAEAVDGDALVRLADMALYRAKALGRDRVVAFEPGADAGVPP